ncbi:hypothetical protein RRG08_009128 [Elysia crispata]|uniref:Uncharacterized protein n=1 Tax=Elysia crispata TaxID=231223 RepID=A0AAE1D1Y4_9GAST|nr:hypothetical protein RRG08_009128 [Elysia crispata]
MRIAFGDQWTVPHMKKKQTPLRSGGFESTALHHGAALCALDPQPSPSASRPGLAPSVHPGAVLPAADQQSDPNQHKPYDINDENYVSLQPETEEMEKEIGSSAARRNISVMTFPSEGKTDEDDGYFFVSSFGFLRQLVYLFVCPR